VGHCGARRRNACIPLWEVVAMASKLIHVCPYGPQSRMELAAAWVTVFRCHLSDLSYL
jgi:hypothetical protein